MEILIMGLIFILVILCAYSCERAFKRFDDKHLKQRKLEITLDYRNKKNNKTE